ncbi:hypothetical protein HRW23_03830 [Streptomyces lunaelactis]|uniref:hypothetical protein n=1 Tax=Streptomyces lunaelactis TaxID=1535768 RepID=UPI0015854A89|nr:hypothetical protein [Streptomyces lunaelactis]NUK02113.1 hypothetical protein [Streptomyces lunaelactis]NUK16095.1 hypothetical protein [Streptomyces lunaelactis]NUK23393.1 hypothetical protein [Streptomyces lunaelactis]NUK34925.1 hypothetical protein [Streptomyces lunaelactis]NUK41689.1 hypothetical protein [Streptomyces lunaelactis]
MGDNTLLVATLTGATAILASWVTSKGSARAAQVQADAARATQQSERTRASRRTAYADVIHSFHAIGEGFRDIMPAVAVADAAERTAALRALQERQAQQHAAMMRAVHVAHLEGPDEVARAARRMEDASTRVYLAIGAMADEAAIYSPEFDEGYREFWQALDDFVAVAREALGAVQPDVSQE